jgi:hypothetical protein
LSGFQANNTTIKKEQANYFVLPHLPVNHLTNGSILAIARKGERRFLDAKIIKGSLPSGVSLFPDGTIAVVDDKKLESGKYKFRVSIVDEEEEINTVKVTLVIDEESENRKYDKVPSTRVLKPKKLEEYSHGEVIARALDPDGQITKAEVVRGKFPEGLYLTHDGRISVNNPTNLSAGNYIFWLYVEDELKGCDFIILSLTLGSEPALTSGK